MNNGSCLIDRFAETFNLKGLPREKENCQAAKVYVTKIGF